MRVEICGGIASGKTTLAVLMALNGFSNVLEDFQANPFWKAFYNDPKGAAFETELTFFLQHFHDIKKSRSYPTVFDHSLLLDLAYSRVTLSGNRLRLFEDVFQEVWAEVGPPQLLVYLRCDPATELARIRARARRVEMAITTSYLSDLNASLESVLRAFSTSTLVHEINSATTNFSDDEITKGIVVSDILESFNKAFQ